MYGIMYSEYFVSDCMDAHHCVFASFAKSTDIKISDCGLRHRWGTAVAEGGWYSLGMGCIQAGTCFLPVLFWESPAAYKS